MSSHLARVRVLSAAVIATLCLLALGSPALGDDGTTASPRTAPLARAIPRTFATYDALIAAAGRVATDQAALDAQVAAARAAGDLAKSMLAAAADPRLRGGFIRSEANLSDGRVFAALRAEIAAAAATEGRLVAGGASAALAALAWQRPLAGEISQPFGPTYLGLEPARVYDGVSYKHFHEGLDIAALGGTPVVAPARGRVVFAGRMGDGAEVVVLAHDTGLVSLYAHLAIGPQVPRVKAGDVVEVGDRIGSVGLTGLTTGYHLHWAVYRRGEPLDPLSMLAG